jgi:hypothetical protein
LATIDAGLFIITLALALAFMLLSFKMASILRMIAMVMFFILGLWMLAGDSVAYISTTHDPQSGTDPQTIKYLISNVDNNNNWMGWIFVILGLMNGFLFFMEVVNTR